MNTSLHSVSPLSDFPKTAMGSEYRYDSQVKARRETEGLADFSAAAVRAQNEERLAKEDALARLAEERHAREAERLAKEMERRAKEKERLAKEEALKGQEAAHADFKRLRALLGKTSEP